MQERPTAGIIGMVFRSMSLQASGDTLNDARYDPHCDHFGTTQVRSMMAVPCLGETRLQAVFVFVNCSNTVSPHPFTTAPLTAAALQLARSVSIQISSLAATELLLATAAQQQELWRVSLDLYDVTCSSDEYALGVQVRRAATRLLRCEDAALLVLDEDPFQHVGAGEADGAETRSRLTTTKSHPLGMSAGRRGDKEGNDDRKTFLKNLSIDRGTKGADNQKGLGGSSFKSRLVAKGILLRSLDACQTAVVSDGAVLVQGARNALIVPVVNPQPADETQPPPPCGLLVCLNRVQDPGEPVAGFTKRDVACAEQLAQSVGAVWGNCKCTQSDQRRRKQQWVRVWLAEVRKSRAQNEALALSRTDALGHRPLAAETATDLSQLVAADAPACVPGAMAAAMFMVTVERDRFCSVSAKGVLQELPLSASAILAHTLRYSESLRIADAGNDEVLAVMGCARHCAVLTTPIFDQADNVAGVMVLAGKEQKAGGMAGTFFSLGDLEIVQGIVRRIEKAVDHVIVREALHATTAATAIAERKWQRLQYLAAVYLYAQEISAGEEHAEGRDTRTEPDAAVVAASGGEVIGGFEADGRHRHRLEQLMLGMQAFVKDATDCVDCRVILRSKEPPGSLLMLGQSVTMPGLSRICPVPVTGLAGQVMRSGDLVLEMDMEPDALPPLYDSQVDLLLGHARRPSILALPAIHPVTKEQHGVVEVLFNSFQGEQSEQRRVLLKEMVSAAAVHIAIALQRFRA